MEVEVIETIKVVPVSWLIGLIGFVAVTTIGVVRQIIKHNEDEHRRLWEKIDDIYAILLKCVGARKAGNRPDRNDF